MADTLTVNSVKLDNPRHTADFMVLLDHYARDPMGGGQGLSAYTCENLVTQLREWPTFMALLAYVGNQPVGMLDGFFGFSTFAARPLLNIHDMVVHRDWRHHGVARALFAAAESMARERDCCKLTLEVLEGNSVAKAAYERLGFKPYQLDPQAGNALFMHKFL